MSKKELKMAFEALDIDKEDTVLTEIINSYKIGETQEISKEDFKKVFTKDMNLVLGDIDPDLNNIT